VLAEPESASHFVQGRRLPALGSAAAGSYKIMDDQGRFLGLGQIETAAASEGGVAPPREPFLRPLRVFPET